MTLTLAAIDQQMQCRKFTCWVSDLEFALDVASQIGGKSHRLLKVAITDEEGNKIQFPVAAFDGDPFSEPIKQLEVQWQRVLSQPINHQSVHTQWLIALARQHITFQQNRISNLEEAIRHINQHWPSLDQTETATTYGSRRLSQYVTQLDSYQRQLAGAQLNHRVAVNRLNEYQTR
jgi:hypothetical protein